MVLCFAGILSLHVPVPSLDLLFTINQPSRQKKKLGSENHGKVQIHRCHMDMSTKHVFW